MLFTDLILNQTVHFAGPAKFQRCAISAASTLVRTKIPHTSLSFGLRPNRRYFKLPALVAPSPFVLMLCPSARTVELTSTHRNSAFSSLKSLVGSHAIQLTGFLPINLILSDRKLLPYHLSNVRNVRLALRSLMEPAQVFWARMSGLQE